MSWCAEFEFRVTYICPMSGWTHHQEEEAEDGGQQPACARHQSRARSQHKSPPMLVYIAVSAEREGTDPEGSKGGDGSDHR